jgi:hypothetical protein
MWLVGCVLASRRGVCVDLVSTRAGAPASAGAAQTNCGPTPARAETWGDCVSREPSSDKPVGAYEDNQS